MIHNSKDVENKLNTVFFMVGHSFYHSIAGILSGPTFLKEKIEKIALVISSTNTGDIRN